MASAPSKPGVPRLRDEGWMVGELIGHGAAPYLRDPANSNSYFLRILVAESEAGASRAALAVDESARPIDGRSTQRTDSRESGGVRVAWGADIKRAIEESKSHVKVHDIVGVRRVGREALDTPNRYKNRWEVETVQFIKQRNLNARKVNEDYRAARQSGIDDPAARALYMIQVELEKLAAEWFSNAEDRQKYIKRVTREIETMSDREAVIGRLARKVQEATQRGAETSPQKSTSRGEPEQRRDGMARE